MNHKDAEDRKMAELYFNQELTPEEELEFEEHLIICEICRNNVLLLERVKEAMAELGKDEFRKGKKGTVSGRHFNKRFFLRIAAVTILMTGLTGLFYLLSVRIGRHNTAPEVAKETDQTFPVTSQTDSLKVVLDKDTFSVSGRSDVKSLITEGFEPDPFYEKLIRQSYRNAGIKVLSPENDTLRNIPVFKWADSKMQSLDLKIINNREEVVYSGKINNGEHPDINIPSGLYYWQLQSNEETLFTGRFVLVRSAPDQGKTSP
jgi:hypothetical protein